MSRYNRTDYGAGHQMSDMTVGDYANGMPQIRIGEFFRSFRRQLLWVIPLFALGAIPAWYFTKDMKRTYEGHASVLVQADSNYFYVSETNQNGGQNVMMTPDTIALNEAAIMKNDEIIEEVRDIISKSEFADRLAPKLVNAFNLSGSNADKLEIQKFIDKNYVVVPRAKSGVIDLIFKHEDPEVATFVTNTFLNAYKDKRNRLFNEGRVGRIEKRREDAEEQLKSIERKIQGFLRRNNISDFDSERAGVTRRTENLRAELNTLRGQMSESEAALASVEGLLRQTPQEINLYVDDRGAQRVAQAELELKQLLAKYLPTSDPVRAKQTEIAELKSLQAANGGNAIGGRRVGPNTVYQTLLTRRNTLQAAADSYREKEFTLQRLLNEADAKVQKLQRLLPEYNGLMREQLTLDERLKGLNSKEQEARINKEQAESENVLPINEAALAQKGRNMKKLMFALFMVGWGFTLMMIALLKVFLDPRLYTDPTRRMRPRQPNYDYDDSQHGGFDYSRRSNPGGETAPIPEAVPMRPAAYQPEQYVPQAQPQYAAQPIAAPYTPQQAPPMQAPVQPMAQPPYQAVPYAPATGAAYDYNTNPYQEMPHYDTGELPASETE